ncbi:MAG: WD40/YVTN/BNR-like repeat-containing protein [Myxococcota bacterium]
MKASRSERFRRVFAAAGVAVAVSSSALVVTAALDPARLETWKLPKASLFAVASRGENVWACGYWGTLLRSGDGGRTWTQPDTPTAETLFAISFADDKNGFAVGASGTILHSTDGGATWAKQAVQVPDEMGGTHALDVNLFGVAVLSATEAFAVGDLGTALHTRDGSTWEKLPFDATTYADENVPERILNAVVFTSPTEGFIGGEFATLLRTHDGGATWIGSRQISGAPPDLYLFNVSAGGGSAAAVGLAGGVLVANADGSEWTSHSVDTSAGLFAIAWQGQRGIAAGDRGVLFVTADGGATWKEPQRPKLFNWIAGATFLSEREAVVVGEGGLILRSDDGGASWSAAAALAQAVEPNIGGMGGEQKKGPAEKPADATH